MIYAIGFLAQALFSARILLQWILSERARQVVSPSVYWILSMGGAYLLFFYGWLRHDFAIVLGQVISYYIYIWNLDSKGIWKRIPLVFRALLFLTPGIVIGLVVKDAGDFASKFLHRDAIPLWLLLFGSAGQVVFILRFVYQWFYSLRKQESVLPPGFWVLSLVGSGAIMAYGIFRRDPVLVLGNSGGFVVYARNIMLYYQSKKRSVNSQQV